jgi:hypothetical protein
MDIESDTEIDQADTQNTNTNSAHAQEPEVEISDDIERTANEDVVSLINIFKLYFDKLYMSPGKNMFDGVNYEDEKSTNRCMELMYEAVYNSQQHPEKEYNKLYLPTEIKIDQYNDLYALKIDTKIKYICPLLLPLLQYLLNEKWTKMNWHIFRLKSSEDEEIMEQENDNSNADDYVDDYFDEN